MTQQGVENILRTLFDLIEDQEGVEITFTLKKKSEVEENEKENI